MSQLSSLASTEIERMEGLECIVFLPLRAGARTGPWREATDAEGQKPAKTTRTLSGDQTFSWIHYRIRRDLLQVGSVRSAAPSAFDGDVRASGSAQIKRRG